ncbi:MAG: hypothetical protein MRJ65_02265 [Candidatus Brocadiaceae bacterium]|nr:hypothetical protein [Candidatus Brocadiaceae bacterium]
MPGDPVDRRQSKAGEPIDYSEGGAMRSKSGLRCNLNNGPICSLCRRCDKITMVVS